MTSRNVIAGILLLSLAGCRMSVATEGDYDPDTAYETLITALDAWKDGNVRVLVTLESPIRFADEDLAAGLQLVDYEFTQPSPSFGPFRSVPVSLTLKTKSGAAITRPAQYQIALEPERAVLRSDP